MSDPHWTTKDPMAHMPTHTGYHKRKFAWTDRKLSLQ